ncbi:UDP-N-acetylmuramoyl-L-alanine--D-glutamate ligase [Sporomusa acidovorans]|uniref:UDP-N-acetylmuramoylalanine--D-glutamate ligase n=1 Tax=Sporomusa acidovorans (strain ATCC 49682 / DSM 3132 / Mol) TaxID=1123286 RepID=A0ABZ3J2E1_SPOA4|nr:UDP-N-acetylmuramoyl-L-alanine--D-glutamate ligase [Sporomusa acidovorans]OZC13604.1 UDP-N-acetylmuramoylalanine--D-glutamate ligase [Sporomusa acidovorans DSM 3132]SDE86994.1 UDP-N-acetylmuramoylalanine--D-glutamate ligase [Sporomusa acidovorans]
MIRQTEFANKKILILGAGISGISVANILQRLGASVTVSDAKPGDKFDRDFTELKEAGIGLALGNQNEELLAGIDYLVLSPGISIYLPLVATAQARGIAVVSEVEIAFRLSAAPMVAITGTNGKTTTTTLVGEILKTTGRQVAVGGNIGAALSEQALEVGAEGFVVAEISSFQLEGVSRFCPRIAAVLNLTPDHLDRHRTMQVYQETKERIFRKQQAKDYLILNYDDKAVRTMAERAPGKVVFFSRQQPLESGIFVKDGQIVLQWEGKTVPICAVENIKIKGGHNVENALAACAIGYFAGARPAAMAEVLKTFPGVEHRIEPVAEIAGVAYYNDSKATNPESSIKALEAFAGHIILIAGGRDKNTDLTEFMKLAKERVDHLILLGEAKERFAAAAAQQGVQNIHQAASFTEAVTLAHELARQPQVVLLSPACASYDMFNNYEERGKVFKELVRRLG